MSGLYFNGELEELEAVWLVSEQAKQLYMHLKSVFGD